MTRRPNETALRRVRKRSGSLPPVSMLSRNQGKSEEAEKEAVFEARATRALSSVETCRVYDRSITRSTNCMIGAVRIAFTVSGFLFMLLVIASMGALYVELFF